MIVVPTEAGVYCLNRLLDAVTTYVHLFRNDYTPDDTTTLASFVECSFDSYNVQYERYWTNAIAFYDVPTSWGEPLIWTAASTLNMPQTIYGYWITDGASGSLLWCERAPAPVTLAGAGAQVILQPRIQLGALS